MKGIAAVLVLASALGGCGKHEDAIVAYGRENNSGTYMYFKEHVLENADFGPMIQTLPGTAAVVNAVSKDKRSIGYGGIAYDKGVRVLAVKKDAAAPAVLPNEENVVSGSYPVSRYLFFYTIGQPEGALKHFVEWARGADGQKICSQVGYFALPADKQSKPGPGLPPGKQTITMKGSDTMVILGGKWVEHYTQKHPDITIQVTGGGSGTGIKALIDGETHICMASRSMKPKELEQVKAKHGKDVVEFAVALDGLAVFVHETNPIREISLPQLKEIYTGKATTWGALGGKAP